MVDGASLKGIVRPPHGVLAELALVGLSRMSSQGSTLSRPATSSMWIRGVLQLHPSRLITASASSSADALRLRPSGCKLAEEQGKYHGTGPTSSEYWYNRMLININSGGKRVRARPRDFRDSLHLVHGHGDGTSAKMDVCCMDASAHPSGTGKRLFDSCTSF